MFTVKNLSSKIGNTEKLVIIRPSHDLSRGKGPPYNLCFPS